MLMRLSLLTFYVITLSLVMSSCSAQNNNGTEVQTADDLIKRLKSGEHVLVRNQTFDADINLTKAGEVLVTAPKKGVVRIPGQLTFVNCVFRGKLIGYAQDLRDKSTEQDAITTLDFLSGLSFIDCEFDDDVTLREATIRGGLICSRSEFAGEADFQGVRVLGPQCAFDGAVFYKNAKFQRLVVLPNANFVKATFKKQVDFQQSMLRSYLLMGALQADDYLGMNSITVFGGLFLNEATIKGRALMNNAHLHGRAEFMKAQFDEYLRFENTVFAGPTRFVETAVVKPVSFKGTQFVVSPKDFDFKTTPEIRRTFDFEGSNLTGE